MSSNRRVADVSISTFADAEVEASLAARFRTRILAVASYRLRGRQAAEDVAQETLSAVLEAIRAGRLTLCVKRHRAGERAT